MAYFVKNIQTSDDLFNHQFGGADIDTISSAIDSLLIKEGYKLISGQKGNGDYEKGNRTMRLLFGAFVKYFKFSVKLKSADNQTFELMVVKTSSGISGGLIGMGQVKNELRRLAQVFSSV